MLIKKPLSSFNLDNIFSPRSPLELIGFILVGLIINWLSNATLIGFIGSAILFWIFWLRGINRETKRLENVSYSVNKKAPKGARGLILLLSPYSPFSPQLKNEATLKNFADYILDKSNDQLQLVDFENIGLFNSNLLPQIEAIKYHIEQGRLRDIWLITSQTQEKTKGSELTAQILEKYLNLEYGQRIDIHCQGFTANDWDYHKLWQFGERIFRESGYEDGLVVADITGGTKMMSVALAMACIQPKRRMQYMESQRDWQGNPSGGKLQPVLIDVNPIFD
jgi:CRISPR-associated protein (Cas_Cas02710)